MSDLPKNLNYRDVYNADDPLASLRAGNPAALPEEEAYRNLMAGHSAKHHRDEPCTCQTEDKFADADEVARAAAAEEADSADALANFVFRESGLNLDALAAAAEQLVDQASDEDDDEEFNPEAPFGLRRLNPLLAEEGVLTPEIQQNLRDLLSQFDEEQMDALARALDAYNLAHAGEDSDDADGISGEDLYRDYTGRIDIDTGDSIPDLTVYDEEDDPSSYQVEKPTAEDFAALAAVEAELDTRWGERQIAPDLSRMERLMDILGHPEQAAPVIQVAGTRWRAPVVPATREAEAGGSLEPRSSGLQCAMPIGCPH